MLDFDYDPWGEEAYLAKLEEERYYRGMEQEYEDEMARQYQEYCLEQERYYNECTCTEGCKSSVDYDCKCYPCHVLTYPEC